jgi:hypothetical protein
LAPLFIPLVLPPEVFVGVTCVVGGLNELSLVEALIVDFDFDLILSSFTSSSSNALEYFFDIILNRSFFYAGRPSFCIRSPLRRFFL